jgi:hypothetical protein
MGYGLAGKYCTRDTKRELEGTQRNKNRKGDVRRRHLLFVW